MNEVNLKLFHCNLPFKCVCYHDVILSFSVGREIWFPVFHRNSNINGISVTNRTEIETPIWAIISVNLRQKWVLKSKGESELEVIEKKHWMK